MISRTLSSTLFLRLVGGVLLAAAVLKSLGLEYEPYSRGGLLSALWVRLAVIQLELFLGGWLVSGLAPGGARLLAVITFAGFTAVSFASGYAGQSSCGCFGQIEVNPWVMFAFDAVVLVGLLTVRPPGTGLLPSAADRVAAVQGLAAVAVTTVVAVGVGTAYAGSPAKALARLRGEVLLTPHQIELGTAPSGDTLRGSIPLENLSDAPVRLIAGTSDCSCVTTAELPLTIPPGETRDVPVRLLLNGTPGRLSRTASFVTDHPRHRLVRYRITASATGAD